MAKTKYEDFDIIFSEKAGDIYPVQVSFRDKELASSFRMSFEPNRVKQWLGILRTHAQKGGQMENCKVTDKDEPLPQEIGSFLFSELFTPAVLSFYEESLREVQKTNSRLRVKIYCSTAELDELPWEYLLRHNGKSEYLALKDDAPLISLVRAVPTQARISKPVPATLRIWVVSANPDELYPINQEEVIERIKTEMEKAKIDYELLDLRDVMPSELDNLLQQTENHPHILQFFTHGAPSQILLKGSNGKSVRVGKEKLDSILKHVANNLQGVVTTACLTSVRENQNSIINLAMQLAMTGIPTVAMQFNISADPDGPHAAWFFITGFYRSYAENLCFDTAVIAARRAIWLDMSENTMEWGTPVFYFPVPDLTKRAIVKTQRKLERLAKDLETEITHFREMTNPKIDPCVIQKGMNYLKHQQGSHGAWSDIDAVFDSDYPVYIQAKICISLLSCGEPVDSDVISKAKQWLQSAFWGSDEDVALALLAIKSLREGQNAELQNKLKFLRESQHEGAWMPDWLSLDPIPEHLRAKTTAECLLTLFAFQQAHLLEFKRGVEYLKSYLLDIDAQLSEDNSEILISNFALPLISINPYTCIDVEIYKIKTKFLNVIEQIAKKMDGPIFLANNAVVTQTADALQILLSLGQPVEDIVFKASEWLQKQQNTDGGWHWDTGQESNPVATATVLSTLGQVNCWIRHLPFNFEGILNRLSTVCAELGMTTELSASYLERLTEQFANYQRIEQEKLSIDNEILRLKDMLQKQQREFDKNITRQQAQFEQEKQQIAVRHKAILPLVNQATALQLLDGTLWQQLKKLLEE